MDAASVRHRNRISFANMALQSVVLNKIIDDGDQDLDHSQFNHRPRRKDGIQQAISFNAEDLNCAPYPNRDDTTSAGDTALASASALASTNRVSGKIKWQDSSVDGQRLSSCLVRSVVCLTMAVGATVVFEFFLSDLGLIFQRPMLLAMQLFCFVFLFYALANYLHSVWINEVVFAIFCVCITVEFLIGYVATQDLVNTTFIQPLLTLLLLVSVGGVSLFLSLDIVHCALVMTGISIVRFLACSTISDLPPRLKPVLVYCCGVVGIVAARYRVMAMHSVAANCLDLSDNGQKESCVEAGDATLKNSQHHVKSRRISLPNLTRKNALSSSATAESTLLMKADGLLEDLIIDPAVPRHIVRVLNAVKSLLKQSTPSVTTARRSKSIPHVSLSSVGGMSYAHSYSDLPYTDDYINFNSNKGLHRTTQSIALNRCSSFGIWTTTTSATGMPSLETDLSNRSKNRSKFPMYGDSSYFGRAGKDSMTCDDKMENHLGNAWLGDNLSSSEKDSDGTPELAESVQSDEANTKFSLGETQDNSNSLLESKPHGVLSKHHISFSESSRLSPRELLNESKDVDISDELEKDVLLDVAQLQKWDYPIFELSAKAPDTLLCRVAYKLFKHLGFFELFSIPVHEFLNYFHALELGYHDNPYHNRIHATDVLHAVFYMTTQSIPGFTNFSPVDDYKNLENDQDIVLNSPNIDAELDETECSMRTNFLPLELMALYTAAAMHDYDHPGRTNAFLVSTCNPLAVLYNNRSVLENHHASSGWRLLLSNQRHAWLVNLNNAQFKRFRFLVIEAILATDLARHFDLLAEFNAKVNEDDGPGIDWLLEADRQMVSNMLIKMADINGPCKPKDLHKQWTNYISEEFYEQGDEEEALGLAISPYMNRHQPQLAKLQESFINHLVAPLCNSLNSAGLLPASQTGEQDASANSENAVFEKDSSLTIVVCPLVQNLEENHRMWTRIMEEESLEKSIPTTGSTNAAHELESSTIESNIPSETTPPKEDSDAE